MIEALSPFKPQVAKSCLLNWPILTTMRPPTSCSEKIGRLKGRLRPGPAELLGDPKYDFEPPAYLREAVDWRSRTRSSPKPNEKDAKDGEPMASAPAEDGDHADPKG